MSRALLSLSVCALCLACDDDGGTSNQEAPEADAAVSGADGAVTPDAAAGQDPDAAPVDPAIADLPGPPAMGEWSDILPGGDTICSRGTPYRFYVRSGDPKKLVIDFQGGGACWDATTCSVAGSIFNEEARPLTAVRPAIEAGVVGGLYDGDNADHPFGDYTLVHLPYCTGDVHWGNATKDYGNGVTIEHKGYVNASTVLKWVYHHYPDVEEVFVTGCSAGSYGALIHTAFIAHHYGDGVKINTVGDSGAGIITENFFAESFPNWNAVGALPDWLPELQVPIEELDFGKLTAILANAFPNVRWGHYTTAFDDNQTFYFNVMGGDRADWPGLMRERLQFIRDRADNFRYFIPPGPVHCVLPYHHFYSVEADGTRFVDWLSEFAHGDALPDDKACQGEACYDDPVCAACVEDGDGLACGFCRGWPDDFRFDEQE